MADKLFVLPELELRVMFHVKHQKLFPTQKYRYFRYF